MEEIITIDGPAASGKTSVSREVARALGWSWVSTGTFYRGVAYMVLKSGVSPEDEAAVVTLISQEPWEVQMGQENTHFIYRGQDVTPFLQDESVGSVASIISRHPKVREALLQAQRDCAQKAQGGLVAEGRDCGSVVFPQAFLKVFLTASERTRALRRAEERGEAVEETFKRHQQRDQRDSQRSVAPLQVPEGAIVVDSSSLPLQEVVKKILTFTKEGQKG